MDKQLNRPMPGRVRWVIGAITTLLFVLVLLGALSSYTALADAGGFPTPTRTRTLSPTAEPSLTPTISFVFPTLGYTPPPTQVSAQFTAGAALMVATVTPGRSGGPLPCWPFAVVLIVIVMIAGLVFIGTRVQQQQQPY